MIRLLAFASSITAAFILALGLAFGTAARAANAALSTADMPLATVTLYAEPCSRGVVLAQIEPERQHEWRNGNATMKDDGRNDPLCWVRIEESPAGPGYLIVSEAGVAGLIPEYFFDVQVR